MVGHACAAPCALRAMGIITALGQGGDETWPRLLAADRSRLTAREDLVPGRRVIVAEVRDPLPTIPNALRLYACRTNALALAALRQIESDLDTVRGSIKAERIAVVMGTS